METTAIKPTTMLHEYVHSLQNSIRTGDLAEQLQVDPVTIRRLKIPRACPGGKEHRFEYDAVADCLAQQNPFSPEEWSPTATYLKPEEAAQLLGVSTRTLRNWRSLGKGPEFLKVQNQIVRYRPEELDRWQAEGDMPIQMTSPSIPISELIMEPAQ